MSGSEFLIIRCLRHLLAGIDSHLQAQALIENIAHSQLKRIVNLGSSLGSISLNTEGGYYLYRSSKSALNSITKSMAIDLKSRGIIVTVIHPGWVKTNIGGSSAKLTVQESVCSVKELIQKLSINDSGSFLRYDKNEIAW